MKPPLPMLGIDLGGTKISVALFDADNHERWRQRVATPAGDYAATVAAISSLVSQARVQAAGPISVGLSTPGALGRDGRMKNCNSTCLNGQALPQDVQAAIGQPVALANDANCLALSEATDGAGAHADVVFAAILGTGAGAGIAVHGQVLSGPNGLAGEWGHNPLPWREEADGPALACYCGQRGCIETCVSGSGLAAGHWQRTGQALRGEEIVQRAARGDAICQDTLALHTRQLARALASIINLLDPDVIVLGGGLSRLAHLYDDVPRLWRQWVIAAGSDEAPLTRLRPAQHGDDSGVRGAAWLGRTAPPA